MTSRDDDKRTGEVLSSLPSTRPQRRSSKRDRAKAPGKAQVARATKRTKPAAVRPSAATRRAQTGDAKAPRPSPDRPSGGPEGVELVGTALQAAGELAQIGLSVGSQAVRQVLSRLPRP